MESALWAAVASAPALQRQEVKGTWGRKGALGSGWVFFGWFGIASLQQLFLIPEDRSPRERGKGKGKPVRLRSGAFRCPLDANQPPRCSGGAHA